MTRRAILLAMIGLLAHGAKPRLLVLTDIGGDPDDQQSLIRLLLYASEFEIEGLIASASGTPGELKQAVVRPDLIRETVNAYGSVLPNLLRHEKDYPSRDRLLSVIKQGDPDRSLKALGESHDTEGSRWIISVVDRQDPRPVNVAIWGGSHDLAQALWKVRATRPSADVDRFVSRLRVHSIDHQDETGPWIVSHFPNLFFILNSANPDRIYGAASTRDKRLSAYRGMYLGGDESLTSRQWIDTNVRTGHGPLGALYPVKTWTAPNPHGVMKEGDTPSWFYFLPHGLSDSERPEWGGWGGRYRLLSNRYYNDAEDRIGETMDARATVWRWRQAFQNDFAARVNWCLEAGKANHKPVAKLNGDGSTEVLQIAARRGEMVRLSAEGSRDPDGGRLRYRWYHYPEPGGSDRAIELDAPDAQKLQFRAPRGGASEIHIILEVTDDGSPALTAYRRAVMRIKDSQAANP